MPKALGQKAQADTQPQCVGQGHVCVKERSL